ncbi:MAG: AEC family transporter [Bacteroidota bacterium]
MENILFILVLLAIGFGLRYLKAFPKNTAEVLTAFVIHVSLPALVLVQIPKIQFSSALIWPLFMPWVMILVSAAAVYLLARLFQWSRPVTGALLLLVPLGNTSFFGIPMVEAFFGTEAISYALLYDQLGTFLALATYGTVIISLYGKGQSTGFRPILKKVLTFPPLIALVLAVTLQFLAPRGYPEEIQFMLQSIAATLIPLVIIAVGLKMEFRVAPGQALPLTVGLLLKLVAAPLLALLLIQIAGATHPAAKVAVFEAGMPAQISAWALAMSAGLAPKLSAMLVGFGILLSFVTLYGLHLLL